MQEKDHIKELFSETFKNYEVPVRPELWNQLSNKLGHAPSNSIDPSLVNETVTATSHISGSILTWVAGAAIVVSTAVGVYIYSANENTAVSGSETEQSATQESVTIEPAQYEQVAVPLMQDAQSPSVNKQVTNELNLEGSRQYSNTESEQLSNTTPTTASTMAVTPSVATPSINTIPAQGDQKASTSATQTPGNEATKPETKASTRARSKADPMSGMAPLTVNFYQNSDSENVEWNFGDGQISNKAGKVDHTFTTPGSYEVTLKSTDSKGQLSTEKIKIEVFANLTIQNIPNIFTPNQDGINDIFTFEASQFAEIEVNVYDKSGKFIHRFTDAEKGWDGKLNNGQDAPDGTYFYIIFATSEKQQKHHQKGTITIKR